jgi:hypothetical protein
VSAHPIRTVCSRKPQKEMNRWQQYKKEKRQNLVLLAKGYAGYTGDFAFAILVNQCLNRQMMNEKTNQFLLSLSKLNKK